jgi:predicted nucleic acid-binding protein
VRRLVIDANIAAKWYLPESDSAASEKLVELDAEFHAPNFLQTEFASIFWKHSVEQKTTIDVWRIALVQLKKVIPNWHPDEHLHDLALELAIAHGHHVFDCIYLALAIQIDGTVVTADKPFLKRFESGLHAGRVVSLADAIDKL